MYMDPLTGDSVLEMVNETIVLVCRATVPHETDFKFLTWYDANVDRWTNAGAMCGTFYACLLSLVPLFSFCIGKNGTSTSDGPYAAYGIEGFKRIVDSHAEDVHQLDNESTPLPRGVAQEMNKITLTINPGQSNDSMGSTEHTDMSGGAKDVIACPGIVICYYVERCWNSKKEPEVDDSLGPRKVSLRVFKD